jgi:hypothetical protein
MPQREQITGGNEDDVPELDYELAEEIARFIADRAFLFEGIEHRAWALTDFQTWASLASGEAELSLLSRRQGRGGESG